MSKNNKDPRQPGMPWASPYIMVTNLNKAVDFYKKAFGFEMKDSFAQDGELCHAELKYKDTVLMFGKECPQYPAKAPKTSGVPSPIVMYLYCEDVDAMHKRAVEAGAKSHEAPTDMHWGDRMCRVEDPDGISWSFATKIENFHHEHKGGCCG